MSDLLDKARAAGLVVLLDGRIGCQAYQSVSGPVAALQRFADAYYAPTGGMHVLVERLRNRAALQIDETDAALMREAASVLTRQHYEALSLATKAAGASDQPTV